MKRKLSLLVTFVFIAAIFGYVFTASSSAPAKTDCAFCTPEILQRQTFYEDEHVAALYTHRPIFPGHALIIPKRHVERFEHLTDTEMAHISQVLKKVDLAAKKIFNTSAYILLQKNGREAGQSVPHVHFHYIPRTSGDTSVLKFFASMIFAEMGQPMPHEEMKIIVDQMGAAMQEIESSTSL